MHYKKNKIFSGIFFIIGLGCITGCLTCLKKIKNMHKKYSDAEIKSKEFYDLLLEWLKVEQSGQSISLFFEKNGYKKIAIYGMKELGWALHDELKGTGIDVKYGIDKAMDMSYDEMVVYSPEEDLPDVDVIVVTAIHYFYEIKDYLKEKTNAEVISLEEVIWYF